VLNSSVKIVKGIITQLFQAFVKEERRALSGVTGCHFLVLLHDV